MNMQLAFVVPAAGQGTRLGAGKNKMLIEVGGRPLLAWTLSSLAAAARDLSLQVTETVIAAAPAEVATVQQVILPAVYPVAPLGSIQVVPGGTTRQQSVGAGLKALVTGPEFVAIHDGARPLVTGALLQRLMEAAYRHGAAIPVLPPADTVKKVGKSGQVMETLPREAVRLVQTPQVFRTELVMTAHARGAADGFEGTDDASLVERLGMPVQTVPGDQANLKVTTPADLARLQSLGPAPAACRVGMGYDVHRFSDDPSRPLILGGVTIPGARGLAGHSDADVLTHAVMDALLGAVAWGDIGRHFPDTDPRYEGADSMELLRQVAGLLVEKAAKVVNIDAVIAAEAPRLAPFVPAMGANIAAALGLPDTAVSIKATTSESLGFVGRGEGIAAYAVCSLMTTT